jgi:hypothetical protein
MGRVRWAGEVGGHAWDRGVFFGGCLRGEWPPIGIGGFGVGDTPGTGVVLCRRAGGSLHGDEVIVGALGDAVGLEVQVGRRLAGEVVVLLSLEESRGGRV